MLPEPDDQSALSENEDELTLRLGALLKALLEPSAAAGLSLAKVSKRSALPMSTLRRLLTALGEVGLVAVTLSEDGRGKVVLTEQGLALAASLAEPGNTLAS